MRRMGRLFIFISLLNLFFSMEFFSSALASTNGHHEEGEFKQRIEDLMLELSEHTNKKTAAGFSASLLLLGRKQEFQVGQLLALSLLGSSAVTSGLKYAVNRKRPTPPNVRKNSSFPSGHATATFAAATVLASSYPRLTVPVFILAGSITYSRLYLRRHWGTDVVAGALIGIYTARYVIRYKRYLTIKGRGMIGAFIEKDSAGFYIVF